MVGARKWWRSKNVAGRLSLFESKAGLVGATVVVRSSSSIFKSIDKVDVFLVLCLQSILAGFRVM